MNESFNRGFENGTITVVKKPGIESGKAFRLGDQFFVENETYARLRTQPSHHMDLLGTRIPIVELASESDLKVDHAAVAKDEAETNKAIATLILFLIVALLIPVAGFAWCRSAYLGGEPEHQKANEPIDAHYAATEFARARFPGAKEFSEYRRSKMEKLGDGHYVVGIVGDGLNAFGGPARSIIAVEVKLDGGKWQMRSIDSQPFGASMPTN
jgi:hypothetical protein